MWRLFSPGENEVGRRGCCDVSKLSVVQNNQGKGMGKSAIVEPRGAKKTETCAKKKAWSWGRPKKKLGWTFSRIPLRLYKGYCPATSASSRDHRPPRRAKQRRRISISSEATHRAKMRIRGGPARIDLHWPAKD